MDIKVFKNIDQISQELTSQLFQLINQSGNKPINIALSGGSTPLKFYKYLSKNKPDLAWEKVHLFWGDERCVPPGHEESNFGQAHKALLSKLDIPKRNIHRIQGENDPWDESRRYEEEIRKIIPANEAGWPVFDWILLGMGEDGHTASIFPDTKSVSDHQSICLNTEHPQTGQKRISLGMEVINQARRITFIVTGKSKAILLAKIANNEEDIRNLPVVLVNSAYGDVEWLLDEDAASLMTHP